MVVAKPLALYFPSLLEIQQIGFESSYGRLVVNTISLVCCWNPGFGLLLTQCFQSRPGGIVGHGQLTADHYESAQFCAFSAHSNVPADGDVLSLDEAFHAIRQGAQLVL